MITGYLLFHKLLFLEQDMVKKSNSLIFCPFAHLPLHCKHLFLPVRISLNLLVLLQIPKSPKAEHFSYLQTRTPFEQILRFIISNGAKLRGVPISPL